MPFKSRIFSGWWLKKSDSKQEKDSVHHCKFENGRDHMRRKTVILKEERLASGPQPVRKQGPRGWINLTKYVQDLYNGNYKTLLRILKT